MFIDNDTGKAIKKIKRKKKKKSPEEVQTNNLMVVSPDFNLFVTLLQLNTGEARVTLSYVLYLKSDGKTASETECLRHLFLV